LATGLVYLHHTSRFFEQSIIKDMTTAKNVGRIPEIGGKETISYPISSK
jgi:hypothetical protein